MKKLSNKELKSVVAGYNPGSLETLWHLCINGPRSVCSLFAAGILFSAIYVANGNARLCLIGAGLINIAIALIAFDIKAYEQQNKFCLNQEN